MVSLKMYVPAVHTSSIFNFHMVASVGIVMFVMYTVVMTRCLLMKLRGIEMKARDKTKQGVVGSRSQPWPPRLI